VPAAPPSASTPAQNKPRTGFRLPRFLRRLGLDERGIALALSLGVMSVVSMSAATIALYTSGNGRSGASSSTRDRASLLAESGLNDAFSVIFKPGNNPLNPYLFCNAGETLPCAERTSTYDGHTVSWTGTLDQATNPAVWSVRGTASLPNPDGPNLAPVSRTLTAQVPVRSSFASHLENPVWNYVYVYGTGDPTGCDYKQINNSTMGSPLYVMGNACLFNSAWISGGPLQIAGSLSFNSPQNSVGTPASPVTTGVHIAGGCKPNGGTFFTLTCGPAQSVYASPAANNTVEPISTPDPAWTNWYLNASPGPYYPCVTKTGVPPVFDNDQGSPSNPDPTKENLSVTGSNGVVLLTPTASYTCRTPGGELSWNAVSRQLTVNGAVFIDGNARIDAGGTASYTGMGTLFVSGSLAIKSTTLCAVVASNGRDCDWQTGAGHWDPNTRFLVLVTGHKSVCCAPDIPAGDVSVELISVGFQGGVQATDRIDVSTGSTTQGPIVAHRLTVGQSLNTYPFPNLDQVPIGLPGQPPLPPTPDPPHNFGG